MSVCDPQHGALFSAGESARSEPVHGVRRITAQLVDSSEHPGSVREQRAAVLMTRARLAAGISASDLCAGTRNTNAKLLHSGLQRRALDTQSGGGAVCSGDGPVGLF